MDPLTAIGFYLACEASYAADLPNRNRYREFGLLPHQQDANGRLQSLHGRLVDYRAEARISSETAQALYDAAIHCWHDVSYYPGPMMHLEDLLRLVGEYGPR